METSRRNPFLDIIKAFCILFVIITHDNISDGFKLRTLFPFWINMAVPMFMIVSGYVYASSFERNSISEISQAYTLSFLMPKFIRYTVPFVMTFAVIVLAEVLFTIFGIRDWSFKRLIVIFFQGGNGPGSYYYPVMLQFLLFYPVVYFVIRKYAFKGLFFCFVLNAVFEFFQRVWGCNGEFYRMLLFRYTFVIAFGSYLWQCKKEKIALRWKIGSFIVGVAFIIAFCYFKLQPKIIIYWTSTCFLACLYLLPIADFLICRVHCSFKPAELVGKASFNIFLTQMVYFVYGVGFVRKIIPNHILQLTAHIALCVGAGLIFYAVEQRTTKAVLRWFLSKNE